MNQPAVERTAWALKWSTLCTIASVVLQIGITAIMGRLLGPTEYGLLAMATFFLRFGYYFSQMGFNYVVMQREKLSEEEIRSMFTIGLLLGGIFALLAALSAPFAGLLFGNAEVAPVIRVMALSFVLLGLSLLPMSLLKRSLDFRTVAIIEIAAFALGNGVAAVSCALAGWGIWSLVAGTLVYQAIVVIASIACMPYRWRVHFSWSVWRSLLVTGAHYSINGFLDFTYGNIEVLLVSRSFGSRITGIYNRAFMLANLPTERMAAGGLAVMFPAFSRLQRHPNELRDAFTGSLMLIGVLSCCVAGAMISAGREIVTVLLGSNWLEVVTPLRLLCLSVPLTFLIMVQGALLDSLGKLRFRSLTRLGGIAVKIPLLLFAVRYGLHSFLIALFLSLICQYLIHSPVVFRCLDLKVRRFVILHLAMLVTGGTIGVMIWQVTLLGHSLQASPLALLAIQMVVAAVMSLLALMVLHRMQYVGIRREALREIPVLGGLWR